MIHLRFFLRSPRVKKTAGIVAVILILAIVAGIFGGFMSPQAGILGAIAAPFQKVGSILVGAVSDFAENFRSAAELNSEKEQLQNEVNSLREQLVDYYDKTNENEFYKEYLEIKEANPDFKFCPALKIATDPDDAFGGFIIDSGAVHGISLYDPVITDAGLVGYISEVGATTSKVTTILHPSLVGGAYDSRTNDAGAFSGSTELARKGEAQFYNLPRTCSVAVGDIIVTSGSGIFPKKLIIGTVSNIQNDPLSSSLFATITPAVDLENLRNVMVITEFEGQGNELISGD